ncbi:ATP-binding protein [Solwaraspora sp. WMMA2056]|uniref:AAA family ATPase n=1 Tax=Solwaraspora sp. WMMA2056 TaxID=3015161 RepID=UPI00259B6461|nr:ATP-binding protein [Solwaraspora sp. WMMA2056]WJK39633.1 ATP-binding protein [Solwaraspora sp. WMMA2056]
MEKPAEIFDRDVEWDELVRFARLPQGGAMLGVVSGRRRQGKTFLLDALVRAAGGFMFTATESSEADALRQYGDALGGYLGEATPLRFVNWDEAVTRTMTLAPAGPLPVVIDEFPFLARVSPALPSIIQRALDPAGQRSNTQVRLLLCGSALSFMGGLLSGTAPLRGRAGLELVVRTLDYRAAARFWGIADPRTALLVNAIVGGTPAYRHEFTQDDSPAGPDDLDDWVVRAVLNPARPLFREARYLLAEEPDIRDPALYHSVLAAIADGRTRRGEIANFLGRQPSDLAHPLGVLEDVGLVVREDDAFTSNRGVYRIAEPLLVFYHAVMRPAWGDLERTGRSRQVWPRQQRTFLSKVVGPRFETICREWTRWEADPDALGGFPTRVAAGVVNDPAARTRHEVDVAVFGRDEQGSEELLAIGEARWQATVGTGHLQRLAHIRSLLRGRQGVRADRCRLLLFSGGGFADGLRAVAATDPGVQLVDLDRLYAADRS